MNIAMLSTFDINGGASIAAYRLLKGLRHFDHNAYMIVRNKESADASVIPAIVTDPLFERQKKVFQFIQRKEINHNRSAVSDTWFSIPYPGYDLSSTPPITGSDIINLHWMAEFQSVETIAALLDLDKPVVWTLHDENAFTGGCHYTGGCKKYQTGCFECSQLREDRHHIPFNHFSNKISQWGNRLVLVAPSRWLADCAKKSRIFSKCRVEVIPNALETDIFKPTPKREAKRKQGLPPESIVLLFGAHTANEKRKGFHHLIKAMEYCLHHSRIKQMAARKQIKIVTFGPPQGELKNLGFDIECVGYIKDNAKLARIYSAADIFVLPSLEDNLPNTMLEAMACGTPVVGFDIGGLPDMIKNGVTGYLAPHFNNRQLGGFLISLILHHKKREFMSGECRKLIEAEYRLDNQAGKYLNLFQELIREKNRSPQAELEKCTLRNEIIISQWRQSMQQYFMEIFHNYSQDSDVCGNNFLGSRSCLFSFLKKLKATLYRRR